MYKKQLFITGLFLFSIFTSNIRAAEFKAADTVKIAINDTIHSDFYAAAKHLELLGTFTKDLIAAGKDIKINGKINKNLYVGGESIEINSTVHGDILAIAGHVQINGHARSGLRGCADSIIIDGYINDDVVLACRELIITSDAVINGDFVVACSKLNMAGTLNGNMTATLDSLIFAGTITQDAEVRLGDGLKLQSTAFISGNLSYQASDSLDMVNAHIVKGDILFKQLPLKKGGFKFPWLVKIGFLLATLVTGVVMIAIGKIQVQKAVEKTHTDFFSSLGAGAVALLATPLAIIISLALVLSIPVALILSIGFIVFAYLGFILFGTFVGKEILRLIGEANASIYTAMFLGVTVLFVATSLTIAGALFWLVSLIGGLGIITMGFYHMFNRTDNVE